MRAPSAGTAVIAALLLVGCGSENRVVGVSYVVSEFPMSGNYAWSCLVEQGVTDGPGAAAIAWTVGTPLVANPVLQFEHACGGWMGAPCPSPEVSLDALDPAVWTVSTGPEPGSFVVGRYLLAVSAGAGGMRTRVDGHALAPLELHALAPASIAFFRWAPPTGAEADALVPLTTLELAPGESALVVPQLRSAGDVRLCGFARIEVTSSGVTAIGDPTWNAEGRANAPLRITAAATSGEGEVEVRVGEVTGTLPIVVQ